MTCKSDRIVTSVFKGDISPLLLPGDVAMLFYLHPFNRSQSSRSSSQKRVAGNPLFNPQVGDQSRHQQSNHCSHPKVRLHQVKENYSLERRTFL